MTTALKTNGTRLPPPSFYTKHLSCTIILSSSVALGTPLQVLPLSSPLNKPSTLSTMPSEATIPQKQNASIFSPSRHLKLKLFYYVLLLPLQWRLPLYPDRSQVLESGVSQFPGIVFPSCVNSIKV